MLLWNAELVAFFLQTVAGLVILFSVVKMILGREENDQEVLVEENPEYIESDSFTPPAGKEGYFYYLSKECSVYIVKCIGIWKIYLAKGKFPVIGEIRKDMYGIYFITTLNREEEIEYMLTKCYRLHD